MTHRYGDNGRPRSLLALRFQRSSRIALAILCFLLAFTRNTDALPKLIGDLNEDGQADVLDVVRLMNFLNGRDSIPATQGVQLSDFSPYAPLPAIYADINEDGVIDQKDVALLEQAVLGIFNLPNPTAPPVLPPFPSSTNGSLLSIKGTSQPGRLIKIVGDFTFLSTNTGPNGDFNITFPLASNRLNRIYISSGSDKFGSGTPQTIEIVQDSEAPNLYIDFPTPASEIITNSIIVAGRVGDMLSGYQGLHVTVTNETLLTNNSAEALSLRPNAGGEAIVDVGIGNNGTFARIGVPLILGTNHLSVTAVDVMGNVRVRTTDIVRIDATGKPQMVVLSGDGQSTNVHLRLPEPIRVKILKPNGTAFARKIVTFEVTRSDGRLVSSATDTNTGSLLYQVETDTQGIAEAWWTLGGDAGCGNNRVCASSRDIAGCGYFCASASPAPASQINIGSGNTQKVETGGQPAEPLRAWVNDSCNGVPNVGVTFHVVQGGGHIRIVGSQDSWVSVLRVRTGITGHAAVEFQAGPDAGLNQIEANFLNNRFLPAVFTVYGVARDPAKATSFSGLVLDNTSQPIGGAQCLLTVNATDYRSATDTQGRFQFDNIEAGKGHLYVNGQTATTLYTNHIRKGSFPALSYMHTMVPNAENSLPSPVLLPRLNTNNIRAYYGTNDVELTCEGMEGLKMRVKAGSLKRLGDGTVPIKGQEIPLSLNQVHHDQIPMPIPDGASPPFAWTLQPGGAVFDPPIEIEYPNMSGLPAGSIAYFLSFNHDTERFEIISSGHVKDDGATIVTDLGSGLTLAGWGCNCPPYSVTGECEKCQESCEPGQLLGGQARVTPAIVCPGGTVTFSLEGLTDSGGKKIKMCKNGKRSELLIPSATPVIKWTISTNGQEVVSGAGPTGSFETKNSDDYTIKFTADLKRDCLETRREFSTAFKVTSVGADLLVDGTLLGDVVEVDLKDQGLAKLELVEGPESNVGFIAQFPGWDDILRQRSKYYFVPTTPQTGAEKIPGVSKARVRLRGTCEQSGLETIIELTNTIVGIKSGFSSFALTGDVGEGKLSDPVDVLRVQQRLRYLGFTCSPTSYMSVPTGVFDECTKGAIKLFQAVTKPGGAGNPDITDSYVDGVVGASGPTSRWLNSSVAPFWRGLVDPDGPDNGVFDIKGGETQPERFGSSWAVDLFKEGATNAFVATKQRQTCNGISKFYHDVPIDHAEHKAGLDVDVDTPSSEASASAFRPFYKTTNIDGDTYVSAGTAFNGDERIVAYDDLLKQYEAMSTKTPGLPGALVSTTDIVNDQTILTGIRDLIVDPDYYDHELVRASILAFASTPPSGSARIQAIYYNDPRLWTNDPVTVRFVPHHAGHFHISLEPPNTPGPIAASQTIQVRPAGGPVPSPAPLINQVNLAGDLKVTASLVVTPTDPSTVWAISLGGQSVQGDIDEPFVVLNVSAPDLFGADGPGSRPDFIGDDYVRVIGHSSAGGTNRYAFSEFFQVKQGQTVFINDLTFTDTPPRKPESLSAKPDVVTLTQPGQQTQVRVVAKFADGSTQDVSPQTSWTSYRLSNPSLVSIDKNGLVTAKGNGLVYVTSVNEGASAVTQINVSTNDPLTTVVGYVQDTNGVPVVGATVTVSFLSASSVTDSSGRYVITNVPTGLGKLTISASLTSGTTQLSGSSVSLDPIRGGTTDAGLVVMKAGFPGMVFIPPGTFVMGSPASERERDDHETQHTVILTKGFWMGQREVTQGEYLSVIGSNPSYFKNGVNALSPGTGGKVTNDLRHPVEQVSWVDATNYCGKLTQRDRAAGLIPADYAYRLPTEAEWEYACRGGTTNAFSFGTAIRQGTANFNALQEYDSSVGSQSKPGNVLIYRTIEEGSYTANAFGLYDMHGNVWEWCSDWYGNYPTGTATDPKGPTSGAYRVIRGGGWGDYGWYCRAAVRYYVSPGRRVNDIGFRVVLAPGR